MRLLCKMFDNMIVVYAIFSNSLIIHAALAQPEHLILVRWMGLEPLMRNELKTRPCLNTRV